MEKIASNPLISADFAFETPPTFKWETSKDLIVRRAVIEIGSARIKCQVADVNLRTNKIDKLVSSSNQPAPLAESLKENKGVFSKAVLEKIGNTILDLVVDIDADPYPEQFVGIATEALRIAVNGLHLINTITDCTTIPFSILSSEQEAIAGLITAAEASEQDPETTVSWDFGGGSIQIGTQHKGHYFTYQVALGKEPMQELLLKIQNKQHGASVNPVSVKECNAALQQIKDLLKDVPEPIREKIASLHTPIILIGINPLQEISKKYSLAEVEKELRQRLESSDNKVQTLVAGQGLNPSLTVSNLILTYGVMDTLQMRSIKYIDTTGIATGIFLNQGYWLEEKTQT